MVTSHFIMPYQNVINIFSGYKTDVRDDIILALWFRNAFQCDAWQDIDLRKLNEDVIVVK